jgi:hypothetical protein
MTNRIKGFTVVLEKDIREDDFERITTAVESIRGVAHIVPSVVEAEDIMNRERVKLELREKLWKALE